MKFDQNIICIIVVVLASALRNFVLGLSLIFWPVVGGITSAKFIMNLVGISIIAGLVLITSCFLTFLSFTERYLFTKTSIVFLSIQQLILFFSAVGGIQATIAGEYANGVVLPRAFIFNDQLIYSVIAVVHFILLYIYAKNLKNWM